MSTPLEKLKTQLEASEKELEQVKAALYRTDGAVTALKFAIQTLEEAEDEIVPDTA